jgi:hypothetical protein
MNCHAETKVDSTDRPELEKLKNYFKEGTEIPWVKVHDLPDFVHFSHKRHVKAGVLCQECHGEVQDDMTVGRRVSELTMGWCLDCHETHPSIPDNYCNDDEPTCDAAELRRTEIKDCWNCHK